MTLGKLRKFFFTFRALQEKHDDKKKTERENVALTVNLSDLSEKVVRRGRKKGRY